ncbi:histidine kinase [Sphingosinicella humi]|uniref:histidine kinase n=2 Tax=Allosphingosinicella humi TaxID=2068657 RepID=A0A2U2J4E4_9SPHN|nr:histidine kinase [Sphingosinicella humi]
MLLILSLGLAPLGLIAILASIESARDNNTDRAQQTLSHLDIKAQRVSSLLSRSASTIRAASAAIALTPVGSGVCQSTLLRLHRAQTWPGRFALYGSDNNLRCTTPGFVPPAVAPADGKRSLIEISENGEALRFALFDDSGRLEGIGEFSREALADLTYLPGTDGNFDLTLIGGGREMQLRDGYEPGPLVNTVTGTVSIVDDRLHMRIALGELPVTAAELLMTLLPVLMWMLAAFIGWIVLDRLLLRPLLRMQRAIAAYQPGDRHVDLPALRTPAREINDLGRAFERVVHIVAQHEAELEAGIERQARLVREVHHRVKNNLQVVASLLNLHARASLNEEVAAAYASIQRRVDALAVVHRNHYAELEENRGVAVRPLISELGANLRATAPASAAGMAIRIDIEPLFVTQDVAVSVAFLITELVEFAMFCNARLVTISLVGSDTRTARLTIESDSLKGELACDEALIERFDRVVIGLSRQLRSALERDTERGRYSLDIAIVDQG